MIVFVASTVCHGADDTDSETVKVIAESYFLHRQSFPNLKVEFDWIEGTAKSEADAIACRLQNTKSKLSCRLIHANGMTRHSMQCDPGSLTEDATDSLLENKAEPTAGDSGGRGMSEIQVGFSGAEYLKTEDFSLRLLPQSRSAHLYLSGDNEGIGIRQSPFNLDTMGSNEASSPGRFLLDGAGGRFPFEFLSTMTNGKPDLTVAVDGTVARYQFSFDPERAFIYTAGTATHIESGTRLYEFLLLDAAECTGGRWFPTHAICVRDLDDPNQQGKLRTVEMRVVGFDADYQAQSADLEIELPAGTRVAAGDRIQWTRIDEEESERFGPEDLAELNQRCVAEGDKYAQRRELNRSRAALGDSRPNRPGTRTYLWVNAALILLVIGAFAFRRLQDKS